MSNPHFFSAYERFLSLMDFAEDAIERKDLEAIGSLDGQLARLTEEMESLFQAASSNSSVQDSATVEAPLRRALERLTLNQIRLAGWMSEIGAGLAQLQQGAVAVRSYGASVPTGLSLIERQA